jgi:putative oxidoreductase
VGPRLPGMTTIQTAKTARATATPGKTLNIALWALQVVVALAFAAAGSGKLLGSPDMIALFDAIGVGQWFRYVTGALEVLGALLLVVPGMTLLGAVLLACVMAGAAVAHLAVLHTAPTVSLVLFALTALIAWGRRSQLARLLRS